MDPPERSRAGRMGVPEECIPQLTPLQFKEVPRSIAAHNEEVPRSIAAHNEEMPRSIAAHNEEAPRSIATHNEEAPRSIAAHDEQAQPGTPLHDGVALATSFGSKVLNTMMDQLKAASHTFHERVEGAITKLGSLGGSPEADASDEETGAHVVRTTETIDDKSLGLMCMFDPMNPSAGPQGSGAVLPAKEAAHGPPSAAPPAPYRTLHPALPRAAIDQNKAIRGGA